MKKTLTILMFMILLLSVAVLAECLGGPECNGDSGGSEAGDSESTAVDDLLTEDESEGDESSTSGDGSADPDDFLSQESKDATQEAIAKAKATECKGCGALNDAVEGLATGSDSSGSANALQNQIDSTESRIKGFQDTLKNGKHPKTGKDLTPEEIALINGQIDQLQHDLEFAKDFQNKQKGLDATERQALYDSMNRDMYFNTLGDDIRNAGGDQDKIHDAWADYHNKMAGTESYEPKSDAELKEDYSAAGQSVIDNFNQQEQSGLEGYSAEDKNGDGIITEDELINGADPDAAVMFFDDESRAALDKLNQDLRDARLQVLQDETVAQDKQESSAANDFADRMSASPAAGQVFNMAEAATGSPPMDLIVDDNGNIIATIKNDEGEVEQVDTNLNCKDCPSGGFTLEEGKYNRIQTEDGTILDVDDEGNLQARENFWPKGNILDYLQGGPTTNFLRGLSGALGRRCPPTAWSCEGDKVYEFFGKLNLGKTFTERLCNRADALDGLGDNIALSKTGGPSQAWASAEITDVGGMCNMYPAESQEAADCKEQQENNSLSKKYIYKLQALVNAQEIRMNFQICLTNKKDSCPELHEGYALLRLADGSIKNLVLDPDRDPEEWGDPVLDWHGPNTKVFSANTLFEYVCIKFRVNDNFGGVRSVLTLDKDNAVCNSIPLTQELAYDNSEFRQWNEGEGAVFAGNDLGGLGDFGDIDSTSGGPAEQPGFYIGQGI